MGLVNGFSWKLAGMGKMSFGQFKWVVGR